METPMSPSHSTLSDLKSSKSRSLRFRSLIFCKGAELGHVLPLNINRKPYMGSLMTLSHLTVSDLEWSISRSLGYQRFISRKTCELGRMLLFKINRKAEFLIHCFYVLTSLNFKCNFGVDFV